MIQEEEHDYHVGRADGQAVRPALGVEDQRATLCWRTTSEMTKPTWRTAERFGTSTRTLTRPMTAARAARRRGHPRQARRGDGGAADEVPLLAGVDLELLGAADAITTALTRRRAPVSGQARDDGGRRHRGRSRHLRVSHRLRALLAESDEPAPAMGGKMKLNE